MKYCILSFCLAACVLMGSYTWAQDTTHFRLGRVSLDKQLTQKITIQGKDLYKIPLQTFLRPFRFGSTWD